MNKTKNPKRLKGVVLYTVVGVMMVLLLFVMSALALAANANRRALQDYAKTQTQYTARSVVESVVNQLSYGSLGKTISEMNVGQSIELKMADGDTLPDGMGTVKNIKVECIGKDVIGKNGEKNEHGEPQYYIAGTGENIVRVSAEIEFKGAKTSSTYSQYLLNAHVDKPTGNDAGLVSLGALGSTNQSKIYGDSYFNVDDKDNDPTKMYELRNDGVMTGNLYFNKSTIVRTQAKFLWGAGNGLVVRGDLINDNPMEARSTAGYNINYLDIPYIYVTGKLSLGDSKNIGDIDNPINIYCGSYSRSWNGQDIYGDIYAYLPGETSSIGGQNGTKLMNWANRTVNNLNGTNSQGGNIFTKGSLDIAGSNNSFTIQGDVIVNKNLTISGIDNNASNTIGGTVVVATGGQLTINNWGSIKIKGGIYCDPAALNVSDRISINGVKFSDYGNDKKLEFLQAVNKRAENSPFKDTTDNPEVRMAVNTEVTLQSIGRTVTFEEPSADTNVWDGTAYVPYGTLKATREALEANTARTEAEEQQLKDLRKYMYDAQYNKFLAAMIRNTKTDDTKYEDYMTGLGYTKDDIKANINNVEVLFPPKMEIPDIENNIVPSQESIQNKFFVTDTDGNKQIIGMVDENTNGVNTVYRISNKKLVNVQTNENVDKITDSCTIIYGGQVDNLLIEPGTKEIWVNLINCSIEGDITVDTNYGGKVNFFVPKEGEAFKYKNSSGAEETITTNGSLTFNGTGSGSKIMTTRYRRAMEGKSDALSPDGKLKLAKYVADVDLGLVPNIYLYMPGNKTLNFENQCIFTGYIYAPYTELYFRNPINFNNIEYGEYLYNDSTNEWNYSKITDVSNNVSIIGSAIVGDAKDLQNNFALVHVTPMKKLGGMSSSSSKGNQWTAIQFGGYSNV